MVERVDALLAIEINGKPTFGGWPPPALKSASAQRR
jgi:hypothetical protein